MLAAARTGVKQHRKPGVLGTGMVPVGSHTSAFGGASNVTFQADGGRHSRLRHMICAESRQFRLVYTNTQLLNVSPYETAGPNNIVIKASVEDTGGSTGIYRRLNSNYIWFSTGAYVAGDMVTYGGATWIALASSTGVTPTEGASWHQVAYYPVTFGGSSSVTVAPGVTVVSDPIALPRWLTRGTVLYSNTLVQPNNGTANTGSYPNGQAATPSGTGPSGSFVVTAATGSAPPDYTASGPVTGTTLGTGGSTSRAYGPMALIGAPRVGTQRTPVVLLNGDSWCNGSNDNGYNGSSGLMMGDETCGYLSRLMTDTPSAPTQFQYAHFVSAKGGGGITAWQAGATTTARLAIAAGCTHVIDELGINDMGSNTFAAMQAAALARWAIFTAAGLKVIGCTIGPETTSTDSWATLANQTVKTGWGIGSVWDSYNTWVRTQPSPLVAVIDAAVIVTDAATGKWNPSYQGGSGSTADGVHPNTQGHIDIAAAAQTALTALLGSPV